MSETANKIIKDIRIIRKLSQEQMANALDVSVNYISLIENDKKKPGMPFLKTFSAKYNVPLLLLTRDTLIPKAKTSKERELRDKVVILINDMERVFLQA
ncbi:MAG: helix-turn-helix transcriptional regulator [Patescibacteria group bacterium]